MPFEWEPEARHALLLAETAAERSDSLTIEPEHLAMALDTEGAASAELARRLGLVLPVMPVRHGAALAPKPVVAAKFSEASRLVVERARRESRRMHARKVGTDHVLLALLDGPEVPQALADAGFTYRTVSKEARRRVELPEETIAADTVMPGFLKGRHVLGVGDLSGDDIRGIFELARQAKIGTLPRCAVGRTAALLFEKPSLQLLPAPCCITLAQRGEDGNGAKHAAHHVIHRCAGAQGAPWRGGALPRQGRSGAREARGGQGRCPDVVPDGGCVGGADFRPWGAGRVGPLVGSARDQCLG